VVSTLPSSTTIVTRAVRDAFRKTVTLRHMVRNPVMFVVLLGSVLTLIAVQPRSPQGLRYVSAAGGAILAALGARWVYGTISGPHFEGYALVLGCATAVQGLLTLATFARAPAR